MGDSGEHEYFCSWKGYNASYNTWETAATLWVGAAEAMPAYNDRNNASNKKGSAKRNRVK